MSRSGGEEGSTLSPKTLKISRLNSIHRPIHAGEEFGTLFQMPHA
jgi:hypothetical protein